MFARARRRSIADDDELVFLTDLELEPVAGPSFDVGRRCILGDHAFVAFLLGRLIGFEAVAGQASRKKNSGALTRASTDDFFQNRAAMRERLSAQILAVFIEAVEHGVAG